MNGLVLAEAIGTMVLVLLGDGVVANVLLARSKGQNAGWIVITLGWGLAVTMAIYAVGRISGAHLNPAVTVGLASIGSFPWANVPGYLAAQMVGAFAGAALVWLTYLPHWAVTAGQGSEAGGLLHRPGDQEPGRERHHGSCRHRHAALRRAGNRRQRRVVFPSG